MPYHIDDNNCVIKTATGKKMGCHPSHDEAVKQMRAIMARESMSQVIWIDPYKYSAGKPFRIFPIGDFKRGDRTIDLTKERLAEMKANYEADRPRWKAPIYAGHPTDTQPDPPKLGNVASLELKDDGLYAIPEYSDKGKELVDEESYQYVSPGVLWKLAGASYTDEEGNEFDNVLDHVALTNRPFFGSRTAIFSSDAELVKDGDTMEALRADVDELKKKITVMAEHGEDDTMMTEEMKKKKKKMMEDEAAKAEPEKEKEKDTMSDIVIQPEAFAALQKSVEEMSEALKTKEELFAVEKARADKMEADNKVLADVVAEEKKAHRLDALRVHADTFAGKLFFTRLAMSAKLS